MEVGGPSQGCSALAGEDGPAAAPLWEGQSLGGTHNDTLSHLHWCAGGRLVEPRPPAPLPSPNTLSPSVPLLSLQKHCAADDAGLSGKSVEGSSPHGEELERYGSCWAQRDELRCLVRAGHGRGLHGCAWASAA